MLYNKTSKKKIIDRIRLADNPIKKSFGLMFGDPKNFDYALIFVLGRETIIGASIHMLFVFMPIDVVYLDKKKKVVDVVRGLKPFTLNYSPKKPAKFFVELPAGKASGIREGQELAWH